MIYARVSILNIIIKDTASLYPRVIYFSVFLWRENANQSNILKAKVKPVNMVIDPGIFWIY